MIRSGVLVRAEDDETPGPDKGGGSDARQGIAGDDGATLKRDRQRTGVVQFDPVVAAVRVGQKLVDIHAGEWTERCRLVRPRGRRITEHPSPVHEAGGVAIRHRTINDIGPIRARVEERDGFTVAIQSTSFEDRRRTFATLNPQITVRRNQGPGRHLVGDRLSVMDQPPSWTALAGVVDSSQSRSVPLTLVDANQGPFGEPLGAPGNHQLAGFQLEGSSVRAGIDHSSEAPAPSASAGQRQWRDNRPKNDMPGGVQQLRSVRRHCRAIGEPTATDKLG